MNEVIFPRSPRETMDGWAYLPRFIDKIRLHLAGKLHADYQENFGKGFDGVWMKHSGVVLAQMIEVVGSALTDGQVTDWVRANVNKTTAEKATCNGYILNRGTEDDAELRARLQMRKEQAGMAHRTGITTFVDFIDADEKRL